MLNACPIPPVHDIVTLLAGCQSAILLSNGLHNDMNPAFVSTIMAPNFEIKEITSGTRRSIPIPNQNICRCPAGQGANPYNVANISTATVQRWGMGRKRCPARARCANFLPIAAAAATNSRSRTNRQKRRARSEQQFGKVGRPRSGRGQTETSRNHYLRRMGTRSGRGRHSSFATTPKPECDTSRNDYFWGRGTPGAKREGGR